MCGGAPRCTNRCSDAVSRGAPLTSKRSYAAGTAASQPRALGSYRRKHVEDGLKASGGVNQGSGLLPSCCCRYRWDAREVRSKSIRALLNDQSLSLRAVSGADIVVLAQSVDSSPLPVAQILIGSLSLERNFSVQGAANVSLLISKEYHLP
jgi:hypothetical protein